MTEPVTSAPSTHASLAGKVAIVLGASRGIGAAAARALAQAGATVVLAARDQRALEGVAESNSERERARAFSADRHA